MQSPTQYKEEGCMQNLFHKNDDYFLRHESKKCQNWSFIKNRESSYTAKFFKFTLYIGFFSAMIFIII